MAVSDAWLPLEALVDFLDYAAVCATRAYAGIVRSGFEVRSRHILGHPLADFKQSLTYKTQAMT